MHYLKYFKVSFILLSLFPFFLFCQVIIKDEAKVGVIVTGRGNSISTTQIYNNSSGYSEVKNKIQRLDSLIKYEKIDLETFIQDNQIKYVGNSRQKLKLLTIERDSLMKIEHQLKESIIKLAESLDKIPITSERLQKIRMSFESSNIEEVLGIFNSTDIISEKDLLIKKKNQLQKTMVENDSFLKIKSYELLFKARLLGAGYGNPNRNIDSADYYFNASIECEETQENLLEYGQFLHDLKDRVKAIKTFIRAIETYNNKSIKWNNDAMGQVWRDIGYNYYQLGENQKAQEAFVNGYNFFEKGDFVIRGIFTTHCLLGLASIELDKYLADKNDLLHSKINYLLEESSKRLDTIQPQNIDPIINQRKIIAYMRQVLNE